MKKFIIIIICFILTCFLWGVSRDSHDDLTLLASGIRSFGLGRSFVALSNVPEAIFANPAQLSEVRSFELHSTFFNLIDDFQYRVLGVNMPLYKFGIGFGIVSNYSNGFSKTDFIDNRVRKTGSFSAGDTTFAIGIGLKTHLFNSIFDMGLTGKYYIEDIDSHTRNAMGFDYGIKSIFFDNKQFAISWGGLWKNIFQIPFEEDNYFDDKEDLSSYFALGLSFSLKEYDTMLVADWIESQLNIGLEYFLKPNVILRAGSNDGNLTLGLGFQITGLTNAQHKDIIELNYAYQNFENIDNTNTHFLGITYTGLPFAFPSAEIIKTRPKQDKSITITPKKEEKQIIDIVFPKDKLIVSDDFILVKGKVNNTVKQLFVNNNKISIDRNQHFNANVNLQKFGKNIIVFKIFCNNGKKITIKKRVFQKASFVDISPYGERRKAIIKMAELGFFSGYKDKSFRPDKALSRAELATILVKAKKLTRSHPVDQIFIDVPLDYWAASYIETITNTGIMTPFEDNTFKPLKFVSYASAVEIIGKFDNLTPPDLAHIQIFSDLPFYDKAQNWAQILSNKKILKGFSSLSGESYLTRGDAALWLYRTETVKNYLKDLSDWDVGFDNID